MQRKNITGQASVVNGFAQAINKRDFKTVDQYLTDGHLFIPASKNVIQGREKALDYWKNLLKRNPDYRIEITREIIKDGVAFLLGYIRNGTTTGKPVCWKARISRNSIALLKEYEEFGELTLI